MIVDSGCALISYHIEMYIEMVGTNTGGGGGGGVVGDREYRLGEAHAQTPACPPKMMQ